MIRFAAVAEELGANTPRRRRALRLVIQAWQRNPAIAGMSRKEAASLLRSEAAAQHKLECQEGGGPKGFVLVTTILVIVLGATLSWAVQKLLDWWWDRRRLGAPPVTIAEEDIC